MKVTASHRAGPSHAATPNPTDGRTRISPSSSCVVHTKEQCLENIALFRRFASCYAITVGEVDACSEEERKDPCGPSPTCEAFQEHLEKCAKREGTASAVAY